MNTALRNWWTTGIGVTLGVVTYLSQAGATLPRTKAEWSALVLGALMAGLGVAAKDAGSDTKPGARR